MSRLAELLQAEGGLVAEAVDAGAPPRFAEDARGLVLEAVREGYELHYGEPAIVRTADRDLALLAGDRLYALGLERLAALGDLEAVATLADLISACARAHAEGRPQDAEAAWEHAARALGGPDPDARG